MNDTTVWCQNASVTEPQRELDVPKTNAHLCTNEKRTHFCRGGACSSRKQTHTAAQTASPKNGTSKPVPYK
ncbi:MAG: hypothetical protein IJZ80_06570, partial [Clostridia bacterium]|nr:hypothetical protein [Clostridia bacterium]